MNVAIAINGYPRTRIASWCLAHLARPRGAQAFIPQIDGLRFVAILAVILYHIEGYVGAQLAPGTPPTFLQSVLKQGYYGVPLFFALSGFIIATPFLAPEAPSLKRYFLRRLSRLEPPYILSLIIVFLLKVTVLGVSAAALMPHLLASLIYSHNLIFGNHSLVNGVSWSLEIEWQFYLLAPLIVVSIFRARGLSRHVGLWLLIVVGGFAYALGIQGNARLSLSLVCYFGFFAAGVWVAIMHREPAPSCRRWDVIGALAWLSVVAVLLESGLYRSLLPLLTAFVMMAALRGAFWARLFGWWPVYCVGAMCYTTYLYHFFVVSLAGKLFAQMVEWPGSRDWALLLFGAITVPIVVVCCTIPYLLIERPFMVWRPGISRLRDAFGSHS